jgi:hypothetical protein
MNSNSESSYIVLILVLFFVSLYLINFILKQYNVYSLFQNTAATIAIMGLTGVGLSMLIVYFMQTPCNTMYQIEGFNSSGASDISNMSQNATMCPEGSKTYTDLRGNTNCCEGDVVGQRCNGTVICTFSGSADTQYPICVPSKKRRKWTGPIDTWVQLWLKDDFYIKFSYILIYMKVLLDKIEPFDRKKVSQKAVDSWKALYNEEMMWYKKSKKEKSRAYQEELMYIMNEGIEMFRNEPLFQNQEAVQKQFKNEIQKEVCKSS